MRKVIFSILFFVPFCLMAQDSIEYTPHFIFQEGIYLNYRQFRSNKPILKENIISKADKSDFGFIQNCMDEKTLVFQDSLAKIHTVNTDSIWGFCQDNTVYILFMHHFYRLPVMGTLCRFVANVKEYQDSPMMGFYDPISGMFDQRQQIEVNVMRTFILDVPHNRIYDFTEENVEMLIQPDKELYTEFMNLKRREKKSSYIIYLQKYNERHPLYF